jgi:hypothetical protein
MANIATNVFYASSDVEADIKTVEKFINDNFDGWVEKYDDSVEGEFSSNWDFPSDLMNQLASQLTQPQDMYMRCLSYCLEDEYAALFIFSEGVWNLKD